MISILNYGSGNVRAFANVYERLNITFQIVSKADELDAATKIVLPGVGAFDHTMELLANSGVRAKLDELVLNQKVPILGVCVGMQILARSSQEGRIPGLGWINGAVKKMDVSTLTGATHLPHMGWNDVLPVDNNRLFQGLESGTRSYFLHSYCFECDNEEEVIATSVYGREFPCAVRKGNIYGVQFHPEKSHRYGVQLLKNFAEL